ncbi:MAG: DUF2147 domain-containing protein [Saprospiraceae bacterium]|nr:DUF2147 domain-containing protein [Lewinella sp.]
MRLLICSLLLIMAGFHLQAQNTPVGTWKSVDEKNGVAKSHIEIYENNGKYYGKIVKLLRWAPDSICEKCSGEKKDQKLIGMVIIEDLEEDKGYWKDGTVLDPESGKEYGCSIWFEDGQTDKLKVRGKHWTGLYRTQTWYRVD